jgi:hypothetical protein
MNLPKFGFKSFPFCTLVNVVYGMVPKADAERALVERYPDG